MADESQNSEKPESGNAEQPEDGRQDETHIGREDLKLEDGRYVGARIGREESRQEADRQAGMGIEQEAGRQEEPSSVRGQEARESMSVGEVKAYLEEHFAEMISSRNKGQLMKAALAALKGKADAKIISEAAGQLCRQEI